MSDFLQFWDDTYKLLSSMTEEEYNQLIDKLDGDEEGFFRAVRDYFHN